MRFGSHSGSVQAVLLAERFGRFGSGRFAVHAVRASPAVRFGSVHATLRFMRFGSRGSAWWSRVNRFSSGSFYVAVHAVRFMRFSSRFIWFRQVMRFGSVRLTMRFMRFGSGRFVVHAVRAGLAVRFGSVHVAKQTHTWRCRHMTHRAVWSRPHSDSTAKTSCFENIAKTF